MWKTARRYYHNFLRCPNCNKELIWHFMCDAAWRKQRGWVKKKYDTVKYPSHWILGAEECECTLVLSDAHCGTPLGHVDACDSTDASPQDTHLKVFPQASGARRLTMIAMEGMKWERERRETGGDFNRDVECLSARLVTQIMTSFFTMHLWTLAQMQSPRFSSLPPLPH